MKFLLSILITTLLSIGAFGQTKLIEKVDLSNHSGQISTIKSKSIASAQCIYAKDIKVHYCGARQSQFVTPDPIHYSQIVLGIDPDGFIPGAACSNTVSQKDWTDFNVEVEQVFYYFGNGPFSVPGTKTTLNIPVGDLYSIQGSAYRFFKLPTTAVAILPNQTTSQQFQLKTKPFLLKVTITGVNSGVVSSYKTMYTLDATTQSGSLCTTISHPINHVKQP